MLLTTLLLLAAVGLVVAALVTSHTALAWGSVALSAVAATLILARWRRSWRRRQDEPAITPDLLLDEPDSVESGEHLPRPGAVTGPAQGSHDAELADSDNDPEHAAADAADAEPGEEDTDAADLLLVYEMADEVVVVDEHPRYHLTRCRWPEHGHTERLPVKEARELGFTPCERCRPDAALARRHRAANATTGGS
ncbi:MAG TPA: hypothetical protein VIY28_19015 [Pseudonocardiaceae bacterium]